MISADNAKINFEGRTKELVAEYAAISYGLLQVFKENGLTESEAAEMVKALCDAGIKAPDKCFSPGKSKSPRRRSMKDLAFELLKIMREDPGDD